MQNSIGRVEPDEGASSRQNHLPGLPEGWRDGEWLITAAAQSVAQPLGGQPECFSVGGLGTPDRPLLQAAAEQRLAWGSANLRHAASHRPDSASSLPADLIEEVCRWLPPRAELSKRGAERAVSLGIIVASLATREDPEPEPEPEFEPELDTSARTEDQALRASSDPILVYGT